MFASIGFSLFVTSAILGALQTALFLRYLTEPGAVTLPNSAAAMVLTTALTFAVLSFTVNLLSVSPVRRRPARPGPEGSEALCKEHIVAAYAAEWRLSEAETDVALFVAKGFSNAEIAELRGCAVGTVKAQLGSLFRKSGLENRVQLISLVADEICEQALDLANASHPHPGPGRQKPPGDLAGPVGVGKLATSSDRLD